MLTRRRINARAHRVYAAAEGLQPLAASELKSLVESFREFAIDGYCPRELQQHAYLVVFEAIRRATGQSAYPVQLFAAEQLAGKCVVEMRTGEGKTLTALFPTFLRALTGRGVHVVTANDYLAGRDAEYARRVFEPLGISVATIQSGMSSGERRTAYQCDVTYGTVKEFGFDYLRDCLRGDSRAQAGGRATPPVQRGHYFALVDEADSVLLDEARTPLLIALEDDAAGPPSLYQWCDTVASRLQPEEFRFNPLTRRVDVTSAGFRRIAAIPRPGVLSAYGAEQLTQQVEFSLLSRLGFQRDRDYIIIDGKVQIVDESTGRVMTGRRWHEPLQHSIEAREKLKITASTESAARVTVQSFFCRYEMLAGMTGTAAEAAGEFRSIYGLDVRRIPPQVPSRRLVHAPLAFVSHDARAAAVVREVQATLQEGRAVLIGSPSVGESERMTAALESHGLEATVLNCHHHTEEAEIIANAGQPGRVTVATNMAGRGTDIHVHPAVIERGGLHVLGTGFHSSRRIDEQLIGRTARQGENGSCRFLVSLDDELLRRVDDGRRLRMRQAARPAADGSLPARWIGQFRRAQQQMERSQRRMRRDLLRHEKQQQQLYRRLGLNPVLWTPS